MHTVRLALRAMATRFELLLCGADPVRLRAAGEEALREIALLEDELSAFRPSSETSRLNARAARGPVRVTARTFGLLVTARRMWERTGGAFDITVGPLMKAWGFVGASGNLPDNDALARARRVTGMHLVELSEADRTVAFRRAGVRIDPGAIGKGFAIDEAARILRECGVERALLHGGTSTVTAIGAPSGGDSWKVAVAHPAKADEAIAVVSLRDEALSVSAVHGKSFTHGNATYGHVLDPRSGRPVRGALLAAVAHPSATACDALSTALLVLGCDAGELKRNANDTIRTLIACPDAEGGLRIAQAGISPLTTFSDHEAG